MSAKWKWMWSEREKRGEDKAKCCWKFISKPEKRSRANLKDKRRDYNDKKRRDHYTNDPLNDSYEWIVLHYLICPLTIVKMPLAFTSRRKCREKCGNFDGNKKKHKNIKAKKASSRLSPVNLSSSTWRKRKLVYDHKHNSDGRRKRRKAHTRKPPQVFILLVNRR